MEAQARVMPYPGWRQRLALAPLWLAMAGGLVFLLVFQWRYAGIDPGMYRYRDDGVITLSHARNWVDFGFIGVNPSGERIEAFSTPLQFLLYAGAYALTGLGYQAFMDAQTLACTFALGAMFALLFAEAPLFALPAVLAAALALTQLSVFLVWHGSGMENALTHALLLATAVVLVRGGLSGRLDPRWAVVPFLASITRVESIYHVAPLLLVFCLYWHAKVGDGQARRFAAWFGVLWLAFNAARVAYFGSLMPNTAVAQGISVGDRLLELLTLSPLYLDQSFALVRSNFSRHGGYLLLLVLPFVVLRQVSTGTALRLLVLGSLALTALAAPFVFGPARLDPARTTTQLAVLVVAMVAAAAFEWRPRRAETYALALVGVVVFLLHEYMAAPPHTVCCSAKGFDATRQLFVRFGQDEGLVRPTVANPDLGVVSWHKQVNVVDLGFLGSTLTPRLDGPASAEYLLAYAAPDIVETHGYWTCRHAAFLGDARFTERYVPLGGGTPATRMCDGHHVPTGYWIRKDVLKGAAGPERAFIDALQAQPTAERIAAELRRCEQDAAGPAACAYVARATYRLLPELRAQGQQDAVEEAFRKSRWPAFGVFLVTGARDAHAWRAFLPALQQGAGPSP